MKLHTLQSAHRKHELHDDEDLVCWHVQRRILVDPNIQMSSGTAEQNGDET